MGVGKREINDRRPAYVSWRMDLRSRFQDARIDEDVRKDIARTDTSIIE